MRVHFVVNENAGRVDGASLARELEAAFHGEDVRISPDAPTREELLTGPLVVAVGGDGTVNRVLAAIAGTPARLGIIPRGTSNDLARALGIPFDLAGACEVLRRGHVRRIDLLAVNGHPFATAGGLGLPADVAQVAERWKRRLRLLRALVYPAAALRVILRGPRALSGMVLARSGIRHGRWAGVVVSNQPRLGGFRPSPEADHRDGRLDLCLIATPRTRLRFAYVIWRILRGAGARLPEIRMECVPSMRLYTREAVAFLGDGECLAHGRRFVLETRPGALAVIAPRALPAASARAPARKEVSCA